jgi:hypothetical protein
MVREAILSSGLNEREFKSVQRWYGFLFLNGDSL